MSLFRPEVPKKEKHIEEHPWARCIKDKYSNKIKNAHNSINNPKYLAKKEKEPEKASDSVQFTIIGDRVSAGFIYCTNLIKGLHKYRPKNFDAPVLRGVSTAEWPVVLNDLKIKFGGLAFCLQSSVAVILNDKVIGGEKELKELVETRFTYHLCLDYHNLGVDEFAKFVRSSGRPFAYMHISIDDEHVGTLIFMLYAEQVPYTCENFLRLCKEKRGGYGGTPIHRIVKDAWIQCGGYGLKSTPLDCENFMIPHDRRGVLCMANDGRHVDCSTQFFVLLQPAPWMKHKYVAFGQLVEGEATLKKIESVTTWYETPDSEIIIYQCGILNMECHDFMINKGTKQYINGHIEDLNVLAELLWEDLMEKVYLQAKLRELERLREMSGEGAENESEGAESGIHATQRFHRRKEDVEQQFQKSSVDSRRPTKPITAEENIEFDVEEYEYEPEEDTYQHLSLHTPSLVVVPPKPYYIPLTDVPYVGEVDSNFDLKRLLQGDYCLESDLQKHGKKCAKKERISYPSELFIMSDSSESVSEESLESEDEKEIRRYLKENVDRVSFAGGIIKAIARGAGKFNILDEKSDLITDDKLRRYRLASADLRDREEKNKKVSISVPNTEKEHNKIKRRQTGFVRPEDLEKIHIIQKEQVNEEESALDVARKVRIASSTMTATGPRPSRRPTGFVRPHDVDPDEEPLRQSVLARLFEEVDDNSEIGPTLKDYKPVAEQPHKHLLLTNSSHLNSRIKSDENVRENKFMRISKVENESFEHVLNLQHGNKAARKISSDYVKTIDQIEHRLESSIRTVEFAKTRPAMSVSDYQMKNKKYQEGLKLLSTSQVKTVMHPPKDFDKRQSLGGLRLPGDSPCYSMMDLK